MEIGWKRLVPLWTGCILMATAGSAANFEELAAQAAAARGADRIPQAIELYEQALQLKPDWVEGWWYVGTLYYDSDRYPDGQRAFTEFVKFADKPPGYAFLGLCEFETGAYAHARDHLQKALDAGLEPEMEQVALFHQALLLTRLGLFDQAWHFYKPLVSRGIRDARLVLGLGLNALNQAMLPEDVPAERKDLVAMAGQAAVAWVAGDNLQAEAAFRALLLGFPGAPGVHTFYGTFLLGDHPDDGKMELRRELELNPQYAPALAMLALVLFHDGQAAEAAAYAKKALEDQPESALAHFVYGATLDDTHQTIVHLEAAEKLDPSNIEYHVALAKAYSKTGRNGDARRERIAALDLAKASAPR